MDCERKRPEIQMLVLIAKPKLTQKAIALFEKGHLPIQHQFRAMGTVSDDIIEILGLGSITKSVLMSMMPKQFASEMLKKLKQELKLGSSNSGVAFTMPISSGSNRLTKIMEILHSENPQSALKKSEKERELINMSEFDYSLILAIVNQGFSHDVMSAAKPAGATGGTVFNTHRIINEETMKFWGLSVESEREIVAIIADADDKISIMKAISEKCGIHSDANGLVLSIPVERAIGLG